MARKSKRTTKKPLSGGVLYGVGQKILFERSKSVGPSKLIRQRTRKSQRAFTFDAAAIANARRPTSSACVKPETKGTSCDERHCSAHSVLLR